MGFGIGLGWAWVHSVESWDGLDGRAMRVEL
jgi:hypothetical protein